MTEVNKFCGTNGWQAIPSVKPEQDRRLRHAAFVLAPQRGAEQRSLALDKVSPVCDPPCGPIFTPKLRGCPARTGRLPEKNAIGRNYKAFALTPAARHSE